MLQKEFRLPRYSSFTEGKTFSNNFFITKVKKNNLGFNRFGFVVGKSVDKRAVKRNRIKRLLRQKAQENIKEGGLDVLIISKPPLGKISEETLKKEIENIFVKSL